MKALVTSFMLCAASLWGCGADQVPSSAIGQETKALVPTTISIEIKPRIEGIAVYAGYWGPGLPPGDPGFIYQTGVTRATGYTFSVPGTAVCGNGFTSAKALDGIAIPTGRTPQGMEMKFIMPNGWSAGEVGLTPNDNEVAEIRVNGTLLAPLPIMTYTGNDNRNLYVSSWLLGCTP